MIVKTSNGLAVCLREWQLRELDHDQHLALLGMSTMNGRLIMADIVRIC